MRAESKSPENLVKEMRDMLSIMNHRGPDGQGEYVRGNVAFGMCRLSIIGLDNGSQPIWNETGNVACVCNGEIYNYIELRQALRKRGHVFSTDSDVEVIVHLFEEEGEAFIRQLNGMFAIALYDFSAQRLLLYRDRIGEKPLYFTRNAHGFYFASEIKSLLVCEGVERSLSHKALDYLLTFNYLPNELTVFDHIFKIMPGEYLSVTNSLNIIKKKYWNIVDHCGTDADKGEKTILEELDDLLRDSVRIRLRSDVPVGAYLSGGLDSSVIVGYASKMERNMDTFSIGFGEERFNELPYSRRVSALFSTKHHEKTVDADFFGLLPRTIWHTDNPHGDVSFLPSFVLAEMTSKYVKTALTGDGGDELFGGYEKYIPYIETPGMKETEFYAQTGVFTREEKNKLYGERMREQLETNALYEIIEPLSTDIAEKTGDRLNRLLCMESKLLLEGNNLVKPDRMGMANSVEARMPFLDPRIIEYSMSLPSKYKIRGIEKKYILKKLAEKILPEDIVYRKKQMFTVPIGEWMKRELKDIFYQILLSETSKKRGLFNADYIREMLDAHVAGKANYTRQLRLLIIIELWHRIYIDNFYTDPSAIRSLT